MKDIEEIIQQKVSFISQVQEKNGSFLHNTSSDPVHFSQSQWHHSVFITTLMLSFLHVIPSFKKNIIIQKRIVAFLLEQKSTMWTFNYWDRNSQEAKTMPYPDDLDDTFCALTALYQYNPQLIDGEVLAKIVSVLTFVEEKEGGPYRTWLVPPESKQVWKDVDIAVNSNIAYFLSLQEVDLPNIEKFIEKAIKKDAIQSPYYVNKYSIIYFISRWYNGKYKDMLKNNLISSMHQNGSWGNVLDTSFAVLSCINLGIPVTELEKSITFLLKNKNASIQPQAFYIDRIVEGTTYYVGSSAFTATVYATALSVYANNVKNLTKNQITADTSELLYKKIISEVEKQYFSFDKEIYTQGKKIITRIIKRDALKHIVLLSYYFSLHLGKTAKKVPQELLENLGKANLLGWIAYTIYDDFLDGGGNPNYISIANIALRELTFLFLNILPENKKFISYFKQVMNEIDTANAWELKYCRIELRDKQFSLSEISLTNFAGYKSVYQKSFGHALGPIAVLYSLGYDDKSMEVKQLISFFKNYIIVRQLNDDAHDWEEDLQKGHITPVVAILLKKYKKKNPNVVINSEKDIEILRGFFWHEVIEDICALVFKHIDEARSCLYGSTLFTEKKFFESLLNPLEKGMRDALEERKKTLSFLHSFDSQQTS